MTWIGICSLLGLKLWASSCSLSWVPWCLHLCHVELLVRSHMFFPFVLVEACQWPILLWLSVQFPNTFESRRVASLAAVRLWMTWSSTLQLSVWFRLVRVLLCILKKHFDNWKISGKLYQLMQRGWRMVVWLFVLHCFYWSLLLLLLRIKIGALLLPPLTTTTNSSSSHNGSYLYPTFKRNALTMGEYSW